MWTVADEHSPFFNDRAEVTLRSIRRYADKATVGAAQEKDPARKRDKECITKRLQIMEGVIKAHMGWAQKSDLSKGVREFLAAWDSLVTFAKADPQVDFFCRFATLTRLKVLACGGGIAHDHVLAVELRLSTVRRAGLEDFSSAMQKQHVNLAVANCLELEIHTPKVMEVLLGLLEPFLKEDASACIFWLLRSYPAAGLI